MTCEASVCVGSTITHLTKWSNLAAMVCSELRYAPQSIRRHRHKNRGKLSKHGPCHTCKCDKAAAACAVPRSGSQAAASLLQTAAPARLRWLSLLPLHVLLACSPVHSDDEKPDVETCLWVSGGQGSGVARTTACFEVAGASPQRRPSRSVQPKKSHLSRGQHKTEGAQQQGHAFAYRQHSGNACRRPWSQ